MSMSSSSSKPGITVCALPGLKLVMRSRNPDFDPSEIFFVAQFPLNEGAPELRDQPMTISFSREMDEQGRYFLVSVAAVSTVQPKTAASWVDNPPFSLTSTKPVHTSPQSILSNAHTDMEVMKPISYLTGAMETTPLGLPTPSISEASTRPSPAAMNDNNPMAFDLDFVGLMQNNIVSNPPMFSAYASPMEMNGDSAVSNFNEIDWVTGAHLAIPPRTNSSLVNNTTSFMAPHSPVLSALSPREKVAEVILTTADSLADFPCRHGSCMRKFSRRYNRDLHENTHVPKEPVTYPCRALDCTATFRRQHDRMRHEISQHQVEPDFSCSRCGKFYGTERRMQTHKCSENSRTTDLQIHQIPT